MLIHALHHSLSDALPLLPFLFLSSLFSEYLEHRAGARTLASLHHLGILGPVCGAVAGLLPMCGLSAAAAQLFAAGRISPGTLIAALASESDEAIPLLLATPGQAGKAAALALCNLGVGILLGLAADFLFPYTRRADQCGCTHHHTHDDHCADHGILAAAVRHTVKLALFLLAALLATEFLVEGIGQQNLAQFLQQSALLQPLAAALIGLIPNCAPSILLTQLHLAGLLGFGSLLAGLTVNAGVGLAVLWQQNKSRRQSLLLTAFLFSAALLLGWLLQLLGL